MKQHPKNFNTYGDLQSGEELEPKAQQYNCMECDHQTTEKFRLQKHMELAHKTSMTQLEFKCKDFAQEFQRMWSLRNHQRDTHGKSKIKCRYKADNTCRFEANDGEECWYDHTDTVQKVSNSSIKDGYKCKTCEETLRFKSQLMTHRKENHPETVPESYSLKEKRPCDYNDKCRFRHEALPSDIARHNDTNNPKEDSLIPEKFFWKTQNPTKPPDQMEEIKNVMHTMMKEIGELKSKIHGQ